MSAQRNSYVNYLFTKQLHPWMPHKTESRAQINCRGLSVMTKAGGSGGGQLAWLSSHLGCALLKGTRPHNEGLCLYFVFQAQWQMYRGAAVADLYGLGLDDTVAWLF